jgi:alkylated DNA nucleotide flippase Atl1
MKAGQLVKWSSVWLAGCTSGVTYQSAAHYAKQIGVVVCPSIETVSCWKVVWSSGEISDVHYSFLEDL